MDEPAVACFAALALPVVWRQPWQGLLVIVVFSYLQPQLYAGGWVQKIPWYSLMLAWTTLSAIWRHGPGWCRGRGLPAFDWRIMLLIMLWVGYFVTTWQSIIPWAAWPKFYEVSKVFWFISLVILLVDERKKWFLLLAVTALSIGLVTVKGGYWAMVQGFQHRVYGPPGGAYYNNNYFVILALMNVPMLLMLNREVVAGGFRLLMVLMLLLSMAAALSSWSRGALLALCVLLMVLWFFSKNRWWGVIGAMVLAVGIFLWLPADWLARMETIWNPEDTSALERLRVWRDGWRVFLQNPWGIGFNGYVYVAPRSGHQLGLDWHNSYLEILMEQGIIVSALWLLLLVGVVAGLLRLHIRWRYHEKNAWLSRYSVCLLVMLAPFLVGGMFISIAHWELLYQGVAMAIVLVRLSGSAENHSHRQCP